MSDTAATPTHDTHGAPGSHDFVHPLPMKVLLSVFAALLMLTVLTVAITYVPLGALNIWAALGIAVVKGALVVLFFMHLKYDKPFYGIVLVVAIFFVALLIGSTIVDSTAYSHNMTPPTTVVTHQ